MTAAVRSEAQPPRAPELEFASGTAAVGVTLRIAAPHTPEGQAAMRRMWLAEQQAARYDIGAAIRRLGAANAAIAALDAEPGQ